MGGKIRSQGIELSHHAIYPAVKPLFYPIQLLRQHLMTLHDKIQLRLKGLRLNAELMPEFRLNFIFEINHHSFNLRYIRAIHFHTFLE